MNTYAYVGGNPVRWIDPTGLAGALPVTPGLPIVIPPVAIPGSSENQAWTEAASELLNRLPNLLPCRFPFCRTLPVHNESSDDGGLADTPAPYTHADEDEARYFVPDPFGGEEACKRLQRAIIVLRAMIAWRRTDLNPASPRYSSHLTRIGFLLKSLNKLEEAYLNICGQRCQ